MKEWTKEWKLLDEVEKFVAVTICGGILLVVVVLIWSLLIHFRVILPPIDEELVGSWIKTNRDGTYVVLNLESDGSGILHGTAPVFLVWTNPHGNSHKIHWEISDNWGVGLERFVIRNRDVRGRPNEIGAERESWPYTVEGDILTLKRSFRETWDEEIRYYVVFTLERLHDTY